MISAARDGLNYRNKPHAVPVPVRYRGGIGTQRSCGDRANSAAEPNPMAWFRPGTLCFGNNCHKAAARGFEVD